MTFSLTRNFFHKRAAIEKDYATSLQKLTEGILKKKEYPTTPTDLQPVEGEAKYVWMRLNRFQLLSFILFVRLAFEDYFENLKMLIYLI